MPLRAPDVILIIPECETGTVEHLPTAWCGSVTVAETGVELAPPGMTLTTPAVRGVE